MNKPYFKKPNLWLSCLGLGALAGAFALWLLKGTRPGLFSLLAALLSVSLFALVGLETVPGFLGFWRLGAEWAEPELRKEEPPFMAPRLFVLYLLADLFFLGLTALLRQLFGLSTPLSFWLCTDSHHYIDIARDWYLSEGVLDRLVQLVFLPGYPVLVRLAHLLIPDYTLAGLTVSGLSFAGCGPLFYRLLRQDCPHLLSLRAVLFLLLTPGCFFFALPMSDSLFLLLCLGSLLAARRNRWLPAGLLGAYAAFTRSLGLVLLVPLILELVHAWRAGKLRLPGWKILSLCLIPLGFGGYCLINYLVAGTPFQCMIYQREHWHQNLGLFFNTASYQTEYLLACARDRNWPGFFGLWLPNLLCAFGALALMIPAAGKLRPSYSVWFLVYFVIAIGPTWLLSGPRYLLSLPMLPPALALLAEKRRMGLAVPLLLGDFSLLYLIAFALRWQVW